MVSPEPAAPMASRSEQLLPEPVMQSMGECVLSESVSTVQVAARAVAAPRHTTAAAASAIAAALARRRTRLRKDALLSPGATSWAASWATTVTPAAGLKLAKVGKIRENKERLEQELYIPSNMVAPLFGLVLLGSQCNVQRSGN
jgi:hypothetical protein